MNDRLRLALAQTSFIVGDVPANARRVIELVAEARDRLGADCIVFPELALSGYVPLDLLLYPTFLQAVEAGLRQVCAATRGIDVVLGFPLHEDGRLFNVAGVIREGRLVGIHRKRQVSAGSPLNERRYFSGGDRATLVDVGPWRALLAVGDDLAASEAASGARIIIRAGAAAFHAGAAAQAERSAAAIARRHGVPVVSVHAMDAHDEVVFEGGSFVVDQAGEVCLRMPAWEEGLVAIDLEARAGALVPVPGPVAAPLGVEASVYRALVTALRRYVARARINGVLLGLSGGLDSALVLAVAVDALGADRVEAFMMPSRHTSAMSIEDATRQAAMLGVRCRTVSIEPAFDVFLELLRDEFADRAADVTEENIQARCRGLMLMAVANKKGRLVLATSNKSELAVGYTTLYGDMAGGLAPLKDVLKTMVYRLARYRNGISPVIPERVIERPPSAELAPDQRDDDTLPPYDRLDPVIALHVEEGKGAEEIIAAGHDAELVRRVLAMIRQSEFKRRQAPPGVRVSKRSFGTDRHLPILSGFRWES